VRASGFGYKDDGCERSLVSGSDEGCHAHGRVQLWCGAVRDGLREGGSQRAAGEEQRDEHGADSASGERKECGCELEHAEDQQFK